MFQLFVAMQLEPEPPETRAQAADREYREQYARHREELHAQMAAAAAERHTAEGRRA